MTSLFTITPRVRTAIRKLFGASSAVPVKVLAGGCMAPRLLGEPTYYETRGGRPIYHPSAYSRKGWSNMVKRGGDQRIVVGEEYVLGLCE